jgi:hypothetical protein
MTDHRLPVLARHQGVWDGEYRKQTPAGDLIERHWVRCKVEVPPEGKIGFVLTTRYWYPDGRITNQQFIGDYAGNRSLAFDDGRISGWLREIDDETVVMRFGFIAMPALHVVEAIQIDASGDNRARSWHWFEAGRQTAVTLTDEWRISRDPAQFELRRDSPAETMPDR